MKKTILPPWWLVIMMLWLLIVLTWIEEYIVKDLFSLFKIAFSINPWINILLVLFYVFWYLIAIPVILIAFFGGILSFLMIWCSLCRPIRIGKKGIRQGIIFPNRIRWEELSGVGMTYYVKMAGHGQLVPKGRIIYAVSGEYSNSDMTQYGFLTIWLMRISTRYFPKKVISWLEWLGSKIGDPKTAEEELIPDKMICIRYSPGLYAELRKKFDSVQAQKRLAGESAAQAET